MRSTVRLLAFAALSLGALAAFAPATGCDGYGGPTGSGGSLCGRLSISNSGISITSAPGCSATTGGTSNVQYDQFGRVTSLQFDIQCTQGGNERLVGSVSSVTYNNLGVVTAYQATINGQACYFP